MKELTIEATIENIAVVTDFVDEQLEHLDCPVKIQMQLEVGDRIFQYTDGVTEATNKANELYGMERLEKILCENTSLAPSELLPKVKADIDEFVGNAPQFDDITMLRREYKEKMKE